MTDNLGYGPEKRREGNLNILAGKVTFRDGFREMLESVPNTFEECKAVLKQNIKLDEGFKAFYGWAKANDIPVVIISSGMAPLIRAVLSTSLGKRMRKRLRSFPMTSRSIRMASGKFSSVTLRAASDTTNHKPSCHTAIFQIHLYSFSSETAFLIYLQLAMQTFSSPRNLQAGKAILQRTARGKAFRTSCSRISRRHYL